MDRKLTALTSCPDVHAQSFNYGLVEGMLQTVTSRPRKVVLYKPAPSIDAILGSDERPSEQADNNIVGNEDEGREGGERDRGGKRSAQALAATSNVVHRDS